MTLREANAEGQTSGTTVGVANSSAFGDDAFDLVSISGMTLAYGNTAMHGTGGISVGTAAATNFAVMAYGAFTNSRCTTRFYFRLRATPTNEFQFLNFRNSSAGSISGANLTPTGTIKIVGPSSALLYTSSTALSLNTWYRFEFASIVSTTAGQIRFSAYLGDGTTAIAGATYDSGTAFNSGASLVNEVRLGKITASAATGAFDLDDFAVNDGSSAFLGPFANLAPSPKAIVTTGSALIDCTGTTPGSPGDTITYSISPSTGTSQPSRGIFLAPQLAGPVTYTVTAAESNGQSKSVTAIVPGLTTVTPSAAVPKVFRNGTWQ